jgi:hypothetical protein
MGASNTPSAMKPRFIGWAFQFLCSELELNFFGSPYEIVQRAKQANIELRKAATHPAMRISVKAVQKDGRVGTFSGGPNAAGMMQLLDATATENWDGARQVLGRFPTILIAEDETASVPLCVNSALGQQEAVRFLIANGAAVNRAGAFGMTPLHWAVVHNQAAIARILLDAGADLAMKSWFFLTAANLAHANNNIEVLQLLTPGNSDASIVRIENILRAMGCDVDT